MSNLILASASPRRQELLEKLNIPFTTVKMNVDETISAELSPEDIVTTLAARKANACFRQCPDAVVIGSDTIVVCNGTVLGKPKTRAEARHMLEEMSGMTHSVYTGVAVVHNGKTETFYEKTDVVFWELTASEIDRYLDSGEPFDKAGGYGIQGLGALFVQSIHGDYYSVVGLPIARLSRLLQKLEIVPFR